MKNKIFSLVNITGLSVSITCCLLIFVYIKREFSYDNFQAKADRTARPDIFILSALACFTIALLTIGFKALSAASTNPVKSLRTE